MHSRNNAGYLRSLVLCPILDCSVETYTKEAISFIAAIIILLVLITFFPQLVLWPANLVYGVAGG